MWGSLTGSDLWVHAGWTMLHYLWVGTLLGLGAWVCHGGVRSASAGARYVVALGCLGALAVAPIAIAVWIGVPPGLQRPSTSSEPTRVGVVEYQAGPPIAAALEPEPAGQEPMCAGSFPAASSTWHAVVTLLPWLWLVGSPLIMAWSMAGLAGAERLRRLSSPTGDRELDALCRRLARSLKISRDVSIRVCTRIAAPVLVGLVRPVILLPPSLLTGLTPRQLEMILLHELAHVRRYDNLVNFVQRMIESALFFHPAVWLVSRWVRREREHCCDELVVRRLGDRVSYAGTLLVVVRQGLLDHRAARPAHAAAGAVSSVASGQLRTRVCRILGREEETMQISRKLGAGVPVVLLAALVLAGSFALSSGGAEPTGGSEEAAQPAAEQKDASEASEPQTAKAGDEPASTAPQPEAPIDPSSAVAPATAEAETVAQGAVRWVNPRNETVWVNLGRSDGLKPGTEFHVVASGKGNAPPGEEKGTIVVTRILGDHLSEGRIEIDTPADPIAPGDRIHSPESKGKREAVVTARIDAEPDDSSAALREEIEALRSALQTTLQERDALAGRLQSLTDLLQQVTAELQKGHDPGKRVEQTQYARPSTPWPAAPIAQPPAGWSATQPTVRQPPVRPTPQYALPSTPLATAPVAQPPAASSATQPPLIRQPPVGLPPLPPAAPPVVAALVVAVGADGLLEISVGSDDGLRVGQRLRATRRQKSAILYLGQVEVVRISPDRAVCKPVPESLLAPIQKGDHVAVPPLSQIWPKPSYGGREPTSDMKVEPAEPTPSERPKPKLPPQAFRPKSFVPGLDVEGLVLKVGPDDRVEISIGRNDGLRLGRALLVYRREEATVVPIGAVQVIETRPDEAVCRIFGQSPYKGIRKGDRVGTSLPGTGVSGSGYWAASTPWEDEPVKEGKTDGPVSETLKIDAAGQITFGGTQMTLEQLRVVFAAVKERGIQGDVTLVVDRATKHQRVVEVMETCRTAGATGIRFTLRTDDGENAVPFASPPPGVPVLPSPR